MHLLVEPEDGFGALLSQIESARSSIDTTIFRFDLAQVQKALQAAVARGVQVRAFVAHTNSGGEKRLRKLETELLGAGVILARSDDDLIRYHGKMLIVDRKTLHLMAFNYTHLDIEKSRSFAFSTRNRRVVQEALKLFEADMGRQPYVPAHDDLVVSPETARARLSAFIRGARRELLIYDPKLTDRLMIRLLQERARKGVRVLVLGRVGKGATGLKVAKLPALRLHARVIVRDSNRAFLGSQSLRKAELDERREVGLVIRDAAVVRRLRAVFAADWARTQPAAEADDQEAASLAAAQRLAAPLDRP